MNFLFTCGGTAGHINPALAVASKLRELLPSSEILFIGANGKMEMSLVPLEGYEIKGVDITNISRDFSLKGISHNLKTFRNVLKSIREAKSIINEFKPDCVIGTGGYVCYPVVTAAHECGIPTVIHESNVNPGLTTRLLAKRADLIFTGFETTAYSDSSKVFCTGTPVRDMFSHFDKQELKSEMDISKPIVLSVMGSLGSGHMNEVMSEMIPKLEGDSPFHLIHVTGKRYFSSFEPKNSDNADVFEYLNDIARYMVASDIVICRSGASTLSELTYLGKPAILVPSPNVTGNHQEVNARALEEKGAAKVLLENEFDSDSLYELITAMVSDEDLLETMSKKSKSACNVDSAELIARKIIDLLNK